MKQLGTVYYQALIILNLKLFVRSKVKPMTFSFQVININNVSLTDVCDYVNITTTQLTTISSEDCSKQECTWCIEPLENGATKLYFEFFKPDVTSADIVIVGYGYNFTRQNELVNIETTEVPNSITVADTRLWVRMIRGDDRSHSVVEFQLGWSSALCECF